jgi:hypothetical protein
MNWFSLHLIGRGETILETFCSSALWQIYKTLVSFLYGAEMQFTTPSQGAGTQASNSSGCRNDIALQGDGILAHLA